MADAIFKSLVRNPDGVRIMDPTKPYTSHMIYPDEEYIFPEEFKSFEGRVLTMLRVLAKKEAERKVHVDVTPLDVTVEEVKPPELSDKIEVKEADTADLPKRDHFAAKKQMCETIQDMLQVRKSEAFKRLKQMKRPQIAKFIQEQRQLKIKTTLRIEDMPSVEEFISVALHGYTDYVDTDAYIWNTKKWVTKNYAKKDLLELFKNKGHNVSPLWTKNKLLDKAWELKLFKRDVWLDPIPEQYYMASKK